MEVELNWLEWLKVAPHVEGMVIAGFEHWCSGVTLFDEDIKEVDWSDLFCGGCRCCISDPTRHEGECKPLYRPQSLA